jgi:hypothetical protein
MLNTIIGSRGHDNLIRSKPKQIMKPNFHSDTTLNDKIEKNSQSRKKNNLVN